MMESLIIKNFKNLKNLIVPDLAQVNLITGKNNVGKSTLLEALFLYAGNGNLADLKKLMTDRGYTLTDGEIENASVFYSLFYNFAAERSDASSIHIGSSDTAVLTLQIKYMLLGTTSDKNGNLWTVRKFVDSPADNDGTGTIHDCIAVQASDDGFASMTAYRLDTLETVFAPIKKDKINYRLIKSGDLLKDDNSVLWDSVVMTEKEAYVKDALHIIEPDIEALSFIANHAGTRVPMMKLKNDLRRYRLSSAGDGINRILTIVLNMVNCENGFFLIDEFENGLHYSVQAKLWEIIFKLSRELNIQVFATTHSNDCIRSFSETMVDSNEALGKVFRLERRQIGITAVEYTSRELAIATNNDIEIR
ncbi:MAG: hypothetical protein H6Q13_2040 [Bacteroidetes bacterium]|nr:hypothetical protein [Bacteroidota bacterium]